MTITLSAADFWAFDRQIAPPELDRSIDPAESFSAMPELNRGYEHYIDLSAGIELSVWQEAYFEDTEILCQTRPHPWVEFSFLLTGSYRLDTGVVLKAGQWDCGGRSGILCPRSVLSLSECPSRSGTAADFFSRRGRTSACLGANADERQRLADGVIAAEDYSGNVWYDPANLELSVSGIY